MLEQCIGATYAAGGWPFLTLDPPPEWTPAAGARVVGTINKALKLTPLRSSKDELLGVVVIGYDELEWDGQMKVLQRDLEERMENFFLLFIFRGNRTGNCGYHYAKPFPPKPQRLGICD